MTKTLADAAAIAALLADQIDVRGKSAGMVAAVLSPKGRTVVAHGVAERGTARPLDGDTAFELASLSKVFTALAFVDMVRKREVALDDPVEKYLPSGPTWQGRRITLLDLATHTSGLPAQPPDVPTLDDARLAGYSPDQLFTSFSTYTLTRPIGSWEYGNWDFALLGQLLARRAGVDFETLIEQRITRPLGVSNTALLRTSAMRLSCSHSADLEVIPRLSLGSMAPAGGMMSTANDLLTLASALLGLTATPLDGLMQMMADTRRPIHPSFVKMLKDNWRLMLRMIFSPPKNTGQSGRYFTGAEAGLGWFILKKGKEEILVHSGSAPGCSASLAINRRTHTAVVVLSNTGINIHDVALHILRSDYSLSRTRREARVAASALDRYVGTYQIPMGPAFSIRRGGDRLTIAFPVVGDLVLRAENEHAFFVPEMDFELRFAPGRPVREATLQLGRGQPTVPVPRVSDAA